MRRFDCRLTAPYTEWSRVAHHWYRDTANGFLRIQATTDMAERGDQQIRVVNEPFSKDKRRLFDIIRSGCFQRNFLSVPLTKALPMQNLTL